MAVPQWTGSKSYMQVGHRTACACLGAALGALLWCIIALCVDPRSSTVLPCLCHSQTSYKHHWTQSHSITPTVTSLTACLHLMRTPAGDAPTPRRDFAACCCGKDQFVVHGGFDGSMELPAMFLCTVHTRDEQQTGLAAAKQGVAASTGSSTGSSGSAGSGQAGLLEASWQEVEAVSLAVPPGRCYHSITYDSEARCLYVFGGYSSM